MMRPSTLPPREPSRVVPLVRRPRVLHVVVAGEVGGAERMLIELASRPDASGADHAIALMTPNEMLAQVLKSAGLRVHDRGRVREHAAAYVWRSLGPVDVAWLCEVMARERATIAQLHTHASQVAGTRAARRMGLRVIRTEHAADVYNDMTCWPFSRWSLQRADAVVAVSEHVRQVAQSRAPWVAGRLRVIHNGVDTRAFAFSPLAAATRPFPFVLVGRLEPCKGIDLALRALAETPGAELHIVGDGSQRPRLESLARALGISRRAHFHGFLADPREVVAAAQACICSSRQEGLGIALLEAMAMGRPVVAFPVGGVPEIVKGGETGLVARDKTPSALAVVMRQAIANHDKLVDMGAGARRFVTQSCTIERMCGMYGEVYRRVMAT
jgi:glycosyltransferase involved in cell wall biosynthesis